MERDARAKGRDDVISVAIIISFVVQGIPIPQPRQRHRIVEDHVQNYTPKRHPVQAFKMAARLAARQAYQGPPIAGPVRLSLLFLLPRPSRLVWKKKPMPREWCPCKPDRDNLEKALLDALKGIIWIDDAQVCDGQVQKMYAAGREGPCVEVRIETLKIGEVHV